MLITQDHIDKLTPLAEQLIRGEIPAWVFLAACDWVREGKPVDAK